MQTDEMIILDEFCIHHHIYLEKLVRLFYELDINLEGIETITYLLNRMNQMQQEILQLNNRLRIYEND